MLCAEAFRPLFRQPKMPNNVGTETISDRSDCRLNGIDDPLSTASRLSDNYIPEGTISISLAWWPSKVQAEGTPRLSESQFMAKARPWECFRAHRGGYREKQLEKQMFIVSSNWLRLVLASCVPHLVMPDAGSWIYIQYPSTARIQPMRVCRYPKYTSEKNIGSKVHYCLPCKSHHMYPMFLPHTMHPRPPHSAPCFLASAWAASAV